MNKRQCSRGHIYDADIYGESCPLCNTMVSSEVISGLMEVQFQQLSPAICSQLTKSIDTFLGSKRCPFCGFESRNDEGRCPMCGHRLLSGYEKLEVMDDKGNTTTKIRLQSKRDVYYEYAPNDSLLWEDAWGKHFLGKCYSKKDSRFLKKVTVCAISGCVANGYAYGMWNFLKDINLDFSQTALIPIIDGVGDEQYYLIEDYFEGVSLYDLMHGQVCGASGRPIDFAVKMYDMYNNDRISFAKTVVKEVLKTVKFMHDHKIGVHYIEPPENIFFTENGDIKIRMRSSLKGYKAYVTIPIGWDDVAFPREYDVPESSEIEYWDGSLGEMPYVYSVGIFLYSIITGHLPHKGGASLEECHLLHSHHYDPYDDYLPLPKLFRGKYEDFSLHEIKDEHLRKVIEKATMWNPHKRYRSLEEFTEALDSNNDTTVINGKEEKSFPLYKKIGTLIDACLPKKQWQKCLLLPIFILTCICPKSLAQTHMRIHLHCDARTDVPIERIDSITFIDKVGDEHEEGSLLGEWFWGNDEKGYYEVLTFNDDRTYVGYDYYLEYGFDTMTYGTYMNNGVMLNLWSNGYGYRRIYRWFVTGLAENALEVITQMGSFVYYRVQPEVYFLKVGEESYPCIGEDYYVFTDGVKVQKKEGKLKGICEGTTYVLKYYAKSGLIMAYKVVVKK